MPEQSNTEVSLAIASLKEDVDKLDDGVRTLAGSIASIIHNFGELTLTVKEHTKSLKSVEKLVEIGQSMVVMFRIALAVGVVNALTKVVAAWIAAATHGVTPP